MSVNSISMKCSVFFYALYKKIFMKVIGSTGESGIRKSFSRALFMVLLSTGRF